MAIEPVNSIRSNLSGERIARILNENSLLLQKSLTRLSSGLRLSSAGDDPSGTAFAVRVGNQISRIGAAQSSISNAKSYSESQSKFLDEVEKALNRMSELSVLAQSGTITESTRSGYSKEFQELQDFISITGNRSFNGVSLFGNSTLQIVVDEDGGKFTMAATGYTQAEGSGGLATVWDKNNVLLGTVNDATAAQTKVDTAVSNLGKMRALVGAHVQRLDLHNGTLDGLADNLKTAKERVTAVDIASESAEFSRLQLLSQAGTEVLAQWNVLRNNLIRLLQ